MCGDLALRGRDDHIGSGPLERIELNALRGVSAGRDSARGVPGAISAST